MRTDRSGNLVGGHGAFDEFVGDPKLRDNAYCCTQPACPQNPQHLRGRVYLVRNALVAAFTHANSPHWVDCTLAREDRATDFNRRKMEINPPLCRS